MLYINTLSTLLRQSATLLYPSDSSNTIHGKLSEGEEEKASQDSDPELDGDIDKIGETNLSVGIRGYVCGNVRCPELRRRIIEERLYEATTDMVFEEVSMRERCLRRGL